MKAPILVLLALSWSAGQMFGQGSKADYARAMGLAERTQDTVFRTRFRPQWLPGGSNFWYRVDTGPGASEFVHVDAVKGVREPLFDSGKLASLLGKALGTNLSAQSLPLDAVSVEDEAGVRVLRFRAGGKWWKAALPIAGVAEEVREQPKLAPAVRSRGPRRSRRTGEETEIVFVNATQDDIELYWVDTEGGRQPYGRLRPGAERRQHTFAGHFWVGTDRTGATVGEFEAADSGGRAVFENNGIATEEPKTKPERRDPNASPDNQWTAYVTNHNLHLRPQAGDDGFALTQDGTADDAYANDVSWSPDSKRLVARRVHEVPPHKVSWIEAAPKDRIQPKLHSHDYYKPGDTLPKPVLRVFDVASRTQHNVDDALYSNPFTENGDIDIRWADNGREFYVNYNQRGHQIYRILAVNPEGAVRTVVEESPKTFVDWTAKTWRHWLDKTGELLWMSERDGWCHLYLVDVSAGRIKNQVTRGDWVVRSVEHVDAERRQLWFFAGGIRPDQDPYYLHLCRVNFDGSGLTVLTSGDGTHKVQFSPDRKWFIDTWSRVDLAPVSELRNSETGALVCELERSSADASVAAGWTVPERFVTKGRDGKTDIYGIIIRPSNFDPTAKYPVIEEIYAGPHGAFVPKEFGRLVRQHAMAELGFVVVQVDGMGTSQRSKAFQDISWKNLADSGFPDRRIWIREAAKTRPWMDLTRVGIYGGSAGGQSTLRGLLDHGDFYKAGVADCGCHDNRMDKIWWNEQWLGWPVDDSYRKSSNVEDAHKLTGKLLLIVGEVDTNVDPASTMQVSAALVRANKDFELLVMPSTNHGAAETPYGSRRRMDFFVKNLMGREPRWE
jgi:dipeptidyl-peptidase-4